MIIATAHMPPEAGATSALANVSEDTLQALASKWASKAAALCICDKDSYVNASHFLRSIKGVRKEIQDWFAPLVEAAMDSKRKAEAARKSITDKQAAMEAPLVDAEGKVKRALLTWDDEQERIRQEQERVLQVAARKLAEEQTIAAAAALEMEGTATGDAEMLQEAQDILSQPIDTPVVQVAKLMPKVEGVSYRDNWKAADAINVKELAAAVAAGIAPVMFLSPNLTALNRFIHDDKGATPIPGVKVFNDRIVSGRG